MPNQLDDLWGGVIRRFEVDLLSPSVNLVVEVINAGVHGWHRLSLGGLRELRLTRVIGTAFFLFSIRKKQKKESGADHRTPKFHFCLRSKAS